MSNPFQELRARLESEAKKREEAKSPRPCVPSVPSGRKSAAAPPRADEDADAALFLRSVAAAPLPQAGRGRPAQAAGRPMPMPAALKPAEPAKAPAAPPLPAPVEPAAPEDDMFFTAMRGVAPIAARGRDIHAPAEAASNECPGRDPAATLRDLLDGRIEFAVCHTEEYMEGFVAGLDPLILGKLRAGSLSPEAHLDLHGLNARQALDALAIFMKNAYTRSLRAVLVITGRGRNSPDGIGVLRLQLQEWLTHDPFKRVVLAFCTAQPHDGGPGAVYVLLRKYKKSRGKIVWERGPGDDEMV